MKVETYKCDVCGKIKGEVNRWWFAYVEADGDFVLVPAERRPTVAEQAKWNLKADLCGEQCVQKKVSEYMALYKGGQSVSA